MLERPITVQSLALIVTDHNLEIITTKEFVSQTGQQLIIL